MKNLEEITQQNFTIPYMVIGEVVNNVDTENRSRLQCKIKGMNYETSKEDLPWCETKGILFNGSSEKVGITSVPEIGTLVYIEFLYHNPSFPIVTGYVRGNKDSSLLHTLEKLDNTIFSTRNSNKVGPELEPLNDKSKYPNNNVIETKTATIEIDDTSGNERISIQHKSGSYFEIRPDGTLQVKSNKDEYHIIKGNIEDYVEGNINSEVKGAITINGQATMSKNISSGVTVQTPTYTIVGDLVVTGDIIGGGIVSGTDCISGEISGNSHYHTGNAGVPTSGPQ